MTRRAERSVRRRGPTDGPPPGTQTAPGRPPATLADEPGTPGDPLLTIDEVTAELRVSRAAFYRWRRQGAGPALVRLVAVSAMVLIPWAACLADTLPSSVSAQRWPLAWTGLDIAMAAGLGATAWLAIRRDRWLAVPAVAVK